MLDNLLTSEVETAQPAEETSPSSNKPAGLPDKFWDEKKQEVRVDALVASYIALEKKLSQMLPMPQNDDDRRRLYKAIGVPDTADEYQVTVPNDLFDIDPDLNKRLHGKGFTPEQVQEVYDLAAEKMVPLILEMASEFQADRELERLVKEFGGLERWKEVSRQLLAYGKKNLPPDVLDGMACSYEGVMALYKMMKADEPGMKVKADVSQASDEADLIAMMKNPKYWRDKDPAFIAKVTAGFEKIYS
jgi:hypothetical protein